MFGMITHMPGFHIVTRGLNFEDGFRRTLIYTHIAQLIVVLYLNVPIRVIRPFELHLDPIFVVFLHLVYLIYVY